MFLVAKEVLLLMSPTWSEYKYFWKGSTFFTKRALSLNNIKNHYKETGIPKSYPREQSEVSITQEIKLFFRQCIYVCVSVCLCVEREGEIFPRKTGEPPVVAKSSSLLNDYIYLSIYLSLFHICEKAVKDQIIDYHHPLCRVHCNR